MRKAGWTFDVIARQLGYKTPSSAYRAVMAAIKKTLQEPADEVRQIEVARLDALAASLWMDAKQGNLPVIDRLLRVMERRSKLLGLDLPVQIEVTGKAGGPVQVREVRIVTSGDDETS